MRHLPFSLRLAAAACAAVPFCHAADLPTQQVTDTRPEAGGSLDLDLPGETGSRLGLAPRETPASVSRIDGAEMAERSLTRAQDAAVRLPGVTESPAPGNGGTALAARGFVGHDSVAQMVDGTRLVVANGTVTYPFSTWPLEGVEVLRGPASVLYGDGALGAAVNYLTKRPLFDRGEREAFVGAGSYGLLQAGVGLRGPVNEVLAYSLYLDADRSGGYNLDMAYRRQNLSAALALRPTGALRIDLSVDAGHNHDGHYFGTPLRGGVLDDRLRRTGFNLADGMVRYDDRVWRAKVEYRAAPGLRLRNETYRLTSQRHWRNAETYAFDTTGTRVNRSDYVEILHDQQQTGNRFDATLDGQIAGRRNRFVVGVDGYRTRLLHTNNAPYDGGSTVDPFAVAPGVFDSPVPTTPGRRSTLETRALFAENALDLAPRWKLVAGLRSDHMELDFTNLRSSLPGARQAKIYTPVTGRIGLVWAANDALSLYGQYGTGTDPLSGSLSLPNGSDAYDLTRGRQLEVGAKGSVPAVRGEWTVALYQLQKRDILSREPLDPAVAQQIGRQSSTGIELALAAEPLRGWTVDANASFLRARYDRFDEAQAGGGVLSRSGNTPPDVPERSAGLWTAYRFRPQWQAGFGARHVGPRQANAANTARLPSYAVLDASLSYAYSRRLTVALAVKNLADKVYALSGAGDVFWLLGAPRTVQLTARARF
ncbi:TonB-dependent receptor [Xylophilus ampelinus]|uniref:Iron complex outermembrane receptor protein n=1 Tax=Xylophilus ampelinus TaxID=54067 RepID=A0A318SIH7_9BURK|nr:TonB-dependent receptor [Xylophilus ampelinus]MCS4509907.1 TonB-dependent receptor [Xylophilus ampelinus]PYE78543.1 iron complex outermembrane receptor protein [Xylophilus ampelinus]